MTIKIIYKYGFEKKKKKRWKLAQKLKEYFCLSHHCRIMVCQLLATNLKDGYCWRCQPLLVYYFMKWLLIIHIMSLIPLILFSNSILYELRHKSYQIKHCMIMDHMPNVFFYLLLLLLLKKSCMATYQNT